MHPPFLLWTPHHSFDSRCSIPRYLNPFPNTISLRTKTNCRRWCFIWLWYVVDHTWKTILHSGNRWLTVSSFWLHKGHIEDGKFIHLLYRLVLVGIFPFRILQANIKALGMALISHKVSIAWLLSKGVDNVELDKQILLKTILLL